MSEILYSTEEHTPRLTLFPRDYQLKGNAEQTRLWDNGEIGVLIRLFTGGGKTPLSCMAIRDWLARGDDYYAMILSYENELVNQFHQEIYDFLGIIAGIEMGELSVEADGIPKVVVASRQSLLVHSGPTLEQQQDLLAFGLKDLGPATQPMCKRMLKALAIGTDSEIIKEQVERLKQYPEADNNAWSRLHKFDWRKNWLVIYDEAHKHAAKLKSVGHVVEWFERNPKSRRSGLTATPKRGDGINIGHKMFPAVAIDMPLFHYTKKCAVNEGWAVPYIQRYIEVEGVDFKNLKKIAGDFDEAELQLLLGQEGPLAKLCQPMLDMVGDRQTLIFSPGVEMAKNVAAFINARCETKCPDCSAVKWFERVAIGVDATCKCGRILDWLHVSKDGEQAKSISGEVHSQDRREVYKGHKNGEFQFLSVCGLCLAKDSRILTDHGEIAIQNVTANMRLWDGVEFVSHDGVVFKGVKPVINYAGLTATEDHNVWTDNGWERFATCKQRRTPIRVSGVEGKAVLESCGYYRRDNPHRENQTSWPGGPVRRVWEVVCKVLQRVEDWPIRVQALFKKFRRSKLAADALPLRKEAVRKSKRLLLSRLRRTGHQVHVSFAGGDGAVDHAEFGTAQGFDGGSKGQQPPLRTWESSLGQSDGASEQPEATSPWLQEAVEVYDILNAGPRHRFTANGLIVSNCREGYNDPDIACVAVFRPVSKKASSLAEQMKGRGCRPLRSLVPVLSSLATAEERVKAIAESSKPNALIVDLVGISGLADCASTLQIYADGLDDEVLQLALLIIEQEALEGDVDIQEVIARVQKQIEDAKEKVRQRKQIEWDKQQAEKLEKERRRKEAAEQRSRAGAEVSYTVHDAGHGSNVDRSYNPNLLSERQQSFIHGLGMDLHDGHRVSKGKAGRIINMLKRRIPVEQVAYENGIDAEHWSEADGPSSKQIWKLGKIGVPNGLAKTGYDASLLIDAKCNPHGFEQKKIQEINGLADRDGLTAIGQELRLVRSVLPKEVLTRIVQAGKEKMEALP